MPTYDYRCENCQKEFELFLSLSEREGETEKKICPFCSSKKLAPMMTFNGGILTSSSPCSSGNCAPNEGCSSGKCPLGH